MALDFQPVTLAAPAPDTRGVLVFREGKLLAVLSCLGDIHEELGGRWFVEVALGELPRPQPETFSTLAAFEGWLAAPAAPTRLT